MDNKQISEKFCKNCKYYNTKLRPWPICHKFTCVIPAVVYGEIFKQYFTETPENMRDQDDKCGPEAKFFESKPSWWKRLFKIKE